jgi:hypothetical protein
MCVFGWGDKAFLNLRACTTDDGRLLQPDFLLDVVSQMGTMMRENKSPGGLLAMLAGRDPCKYYD